MRLRAVGAVVVTAATVAGFCGAAVAGPVNVDFSVDDNSNVLGNGQIIDTEFFNYFSISSIDAGVSHLGPTIFDSTPAGPNAGGGDPDLLVNLGNIMILQNTAFGANDGFFFNTPDDEADYNPTGEGNITFNFNQPVSMNSVTLIDINGGVLMDVLLTDSFGRNRLYAVPSMWTHDITVGGPDGYDTLDLTSLAPQLGEGGALTNVIEDAGFDANDVFTVNFRLHGSSPSGAIDNLSFSVVPAPGAFALLGGAALLGRRRRRG